ncbi:energy-coupling factor ABC transporter ATP-binding protein [Martelella alba]|uniref:Energy-coupling factor ABC transporter ATP-binding protein n=1 Tax=Martelella alba TaxID=2590451 RepID=A0A506UD01_9HYPH|nr:energy-coupling factor ABC transporter ATP-binding protein [Martelella alba]TPW31478.1 energy-coupling factor ABC transporter ATP-binding protein [Martelella alba]
MQIIFENASVTLEGRTVLHPLNLSLRERRIGIIGLNGSGKTTFARLINGLSVPTSGHVTVNNRDTVTERQAVMADAGFVFQNPQNQIILPILKDDIALGLKAHGLAKGERDARISETLERLGIAHLAERRAHELSGGELQLAALAAVLAPRPSLVILDEPTNQLDLRNRAIVRTAITTLAEDLIVISHDLALMADMERILLFDQGVIVADGAPETVIARYQEMNG